jgi:hypothetical protein
MKNLIVGFMLIPIFVLAIAQPIKLDKPVFCDKTQTVIKALTNENVKEQPIWIGTDEDSRYSLFANEKEGTWTIIQFNKDVACILGTGENHKLIIPKEKI